MSATQKEKKNMEGLLFENWIPFLIWSGFFQTMKQEREQKGKDSLEPLTFCAFVLWVQPIVMCINLNDMG